MFMCAICGKKPFHGSTITYRGMLKKDGGVGRKTVRRNPRRFLPNLQPLTIVLKGRVTKSKVCTTCIRSNRVVRAPQNASRRSETAAVV